MSGEAAKPANAGLNQKSTIMTPDINYHKFKLVNKETDFSTYQRSFSGRITKGRFKALNRTCKKYSFQEPYCGHQHDCCGCLTSQSMTMTHRKNLTTITLTRHFNY